MRRRLAALTLAVLLPLPALCAEVVVRSGETLSDIAARHDVSVTRLMQVNGIKDPDLVQAGTRLRLPASSRPGSAGAAGGASQARSHTVQNGETLSEIADRYGLSTSRLMQLNGIDDPNLVVAGTRLTLRPQASRPAARPNRSAATNAGATARHTVREGETLSEIADRYGLSSGRLMQLNGIQDPNLVLAGSQLLVPAPKPTARPSVTAPARPTYNRQAREHLVRPGETLSDIAEGYKLPLERLISLNALKDPDNLISGTSLKLRAPATTTAAKPTAPKPTAPKPTAPKPPAAKASATKPIATNPSATKPSATKPPTANPAAVKPPTAQPPSPTPKPSAPAVAGQPAPQPAPTTTAAPTPAPTSPAAVASHAASASPTPAVSGSSPANALPSAQANAPNPSPARTAFGAAATTLQSSEPKPSPSAASFTAATAVAARNEPADRSPVSRQIPAAATPVPSATRASSSSAAARTPSPNPTTPRAIATATTATTTTTTARPATPDWRTYGPLQIDWANWYAMGGSFVAPSLNRDGQPLYLAVNCKARKINATSQAGQWNTWDSPQSDFELQLVNDICRQKGG